MAAAVADFTVTPSTMKLKKRDGVPGAAVRAHCRHRARPRRRSDTSGQVIVGFAAETTDVMDERRGEAATRRTSTCSS